jgi:hypothetical protein
VVYRLLPLQGKPATVENTFSDMREVDGIKLPFRIAITQDGKPAAAIVVEEYKLNQGLKPEDIEKRP